MNIPLTQTKDWQKLQDDLGNRSFFLREKGYQFLAILNHTRVGNYLYLPYGPVTSSREGFDAAIAKLQSLATEHDAIFIRIEPQNTEIDISKYNTIKSKDLNPKETWVLDLDHDLAKLTEKLPSRLLRYYKGAEKKGITITKSHEPSDIRYLVDLQRSLAKDKGINTFSEHYLKTELSQSFATLYLVNYQGEEMKSPEVIAAGLVFDDDKTRYNLQGAQNDIGRKLHATGILTIELILDAHKKGLKLFDFWGIAPEDAPSDHPWKGFTDFKKTFAGREVGYLGTYDIVIKPAKYKIYQFFRKLNRLIRA